MLPRTPRTLVLSLIWPARRTVPDLLVWSWQGSIQEIVTPDLLVEDDE